jgi:hypothetical protein
MAAAGGSLKPGLSTPQIIAFTMISSGRDDSVGMCEQ